jgi:hypothetical protein
MNIENKLIVASIIITTFISNVEVAGAQGLKGAQMPKKILGRLTYLPGNNDKERWKVFLDVQPKLVGMRADELFRHFGKDPIGASDQSSVEYGLTQEPVKSGSKSKTWLHIKIFLRNGTVWKYTVEAVQ